MHKRHIGQQGFSLIEVIIVVALIAFVYAVALPNLTQKTGTAIASKLSQLSGDFRNAYDLAVLSGKNYRFVFMLATGEYWLEEGDKADFMLGNEKLNRDPTEAEEKDHEQALESRFLEYTELAGQSFVDPESDKVVAPDSPILTAKDSLKLPTWTRVENMEWAVRNLGPELVIKEMQAEHHGQKQEVTELGPEARAMVYVFASGYIERTVMYIYETKGDMVPDTDSIPYTLTTDSYEGTARVEPGRAEVDVHAAHEE